MSRAVAAALRQRSVPVMEPTYRLDHVAGKLARQAAKLWYALRHVIRDPRTSVRWIRTVLGSRQRAFASSWVEGINLLYLLDLIRNQEARPGVHLFDQGLFQALWSLGYDATLTDVISPPVIQEIRSCLPETAVVVLVEASVGAARARLLGRLRTTSRVQRDVAVGRSALAFEQATAVLRRAEAAAEQLARDGRIRRLRVSNERDAELLSGAECVADALTEVLREASAAVPIVKATRAG